MNPHDRRMMQLAPRARPSDFANEDEIIASAVQRKTDKLKRQLEEVLEQNRVLRALADGQGERVELLSKGVTLRFEQHAAELRDINAELRRLHARLNSRPTASAS